MGCGSNTSPWGTVVIGDMRYAKDSVLVRSPNPLATGRLFTVATEFIACPPSELLV